VSEKVKERNSKEFEEFKEKQKEINEVFFLQLKKLEEFLEKKTSGN